MKNPFQKSKTNSQSKVVVGGKKKAPRSKWKIAYLSLAGLLLFTTFGYSGYVTFRRHQLKAHASGWTYLYYNGSAPAGWMRACKTYVNSPYGPLWQINFQVYRTNTSIIGVGINNNRTNQAATNYGWFYGIIDGVTAYTPVYSNDTVSFLAITTPGYGWQAGSTWTSPSSLVDC